MYTSFYNLEVKPFQISSDPAFIWLGEKHREALATLTYGVLDNKGFMLLTGDVGTGKTTLINTLIEGLSDDILYASVPDPRLELNDFLNYIAQAFNINKEFESKGRFLLHFREFLLRAYEEEKKVLLLIDESQLLTQDLLEEIRLLSNIQKDGNNLLNIFFVGQDEFNEILDSPVNRAVAQRLTLNYHLRPLTEKETDSYIRHRLRVAGTAEQLFDADAVQEIHANSGGFPRRINIICDHCLLRGFVKEIKMIDGALVRGCALDLKIPRYTSPKIPPPRPVAPQPEFTPAQFVQQRATVRPPAARRQYVFPWIISAMLMFFVMLVLFSFVSPASFLSTYNEVDNYVIALKDKLLGQGEVTTTPTPPIAPVEKLPAVGGPSQAGVEPQILSSPETVKKTAAYEDVTPSLLDKRKTDAMGSGLPLSPDEKTGRNEGGDDVKDQVTPDQATSRSVPAAVQVVTEPNTLEETSRISEGVVIDSGQGKVPQGPGPRRPALTQATTQATTQASRALPEKTVMVRFDADSSDFYFTDLGDVDDFVSVIKSHPNAVVVISGHTDSYGSENYNVKLSLFRANMLKSFFLGKGIEQYQLKVQGFGSQNPVATNDTPEGRRQNRRVEIDVLTY